MGCPVSPNTFAAASKALSFFGSVAGAAFAAAFFGEGASLVGAVFRAVGFFLAEMVWSFVREPGARRRDVRIYV
jgi:hypothetical protein